MLVISALNEDIEYSIPISFIVTLATFSDVNEALNAKFDLEPGSIIKNESEVSVEKNSFFLPALLM